MFEMLLLRIKLYLVFIRNKTKLNIKKNPVKKNIFLFLGADYGNLGDVAITYAQTKYLESQYPDYNIIEIPISQTFSGIKSVKEVIDDDDIITLIGGGNTSDLYDDIEFFRQLVILNFRKYKIICFPQTFDFSDTFKGRLCKSLAYCVYSLSKDLTIMAREANTMKVLESDFPKIKSFMIPDIVMTLDIRKQTERKGVLVCMRSDKEQTVSAEMQCEVINLLQEKYSIVDYQDTQIDGIDKNNRFDCLEKLIFNFQSHNLVVTDRLHGMIISYVTGTPALVFDNSNHKVSACYEWIKDCGYIKMIQNSDEIFPFDPIDNFEATHTTIINQYNTLQWLKSL